MSFDQAERERVRLADDLRNAGVTLKRTAATAYTAGSLSEYEARKVIRASTALTEIADKIVADTKEAA